ncbi:MAG: phosphatidate cytidylyltransferase [Niabella sp.]
MAFNWSTFRTRAFTALVFVAVMMFGLLYNNWSLFLLLSVIYFGCLWEYCGLIEKICSAPIHIYIKLGCALLGYHVLLFLTGDHLELGGYGIKSSFSLPFLIAGMVLFIPGIFKMQGITKKMLLLLFGGLFYTALPLGLLLNLAAPQAPVPAHFGSFIVIYIIGSLWINDTMAYLCGSIIGRTSLSKISPKKTWEGTISGIILSPSLTWLLFSLIFFHSAQWPLVSVGAAISGLAAIFGTLGDLLESKIKRMANVKDSGHIMPGHGGFLDRFDSLLIAVPAVWLFLSIYHLF